jgi:hypothetical protein
MQLRLWLLAVAMAGSILPDMQISWLAGLAISMLSASWAIADEPAAVAVSIKRQMVVCMNKNMAADRTLSYNEAQKDCKDRLVARGQPPIGKQALASNAADSAAHKTP